MARKEIEITLDDDDQKLTFKIRQMPATQLESWIIRAVLLVASGGLQVPDGSDLRAAGAYLASQGLSALGKIDYEKAKPLLDELLSCCSRLVEGVEERCTPASVSYIQDVTTLLKLRMEAGKLNLGFLRPEGVNLSGSREKPSTETMPPKAATRNMPTSQAL